jgi:hypothetical protein
MPTHSQLSQNSKIATAGFWHSVSIGWSDCLVDRQQLMISELLIGLPISNVVVSTRTVLEAGKNRSGHQRWTRILP